MFNVLTTASFNRFDIIRNRMENSPILQTKLQIELILHNEIKRTRIVKV